ncbi:hypothetical protein NPIL_527681 [Nephila pilipes]|uniref:Uncharacterized protein n=1 Tax=Nephila pilipes TaxID=299642 RepID=A0A8X6P937_NEPPI|nr:hypothetical protein NPIL_527681 [Nephila pilipes]
MLRRSGITKYEAMIFFESFSSDGRDTPVESSSPEEMLNDDLPVDSQSDFQNIGNVDSSSDEYMEEQSVLRVYNLRIRFYIVIKKFQGITLNSQFAA